MVGCGLRFSDKENSSKEYEVFSLCGISLRNSKICLCDKCEKKLDALHENKDNNSHPSIKRNKNEARDDASSTQDALHENQDKYAPAISGSNAENDDSSLESRYVSKNPDVKVADHEKPEVQE